MVPLAGVMDYVVMLIIAAVVGGIGGIGAELLQDRMQQTGTIEKPGAIKDSHLYDLGWIASILLGAMAAVAILYFLPPQITTIVQGENGLSKTTVSYEIIKVVALSLIVGVAGSTILRLLVERLQALLEQQRAKLRADFNARAFTALTAPLKADVRAAVRATGELHGARQGAGSSAKDQKTSLMASLPPEVLASYESELASRLEERLQVRIETVRNMLQATDPPGRETMMQEPART